MQDIERRTASVFNASATPAVQNPVRKIQLQERYLHYQNQQVPSALKSRYSTSLARLAGLRRLVALACVVSLYHLVEVLAE